jgi:hypothetical protein
MIHENFDDRFQSRRLNLMLPHLRIHTVVWTMINRYETDPSRLGAHEIPNLSAIFGRALIHYQHGKATIIGLEQLINERASQKRPAISHIERHRAKFVAVHNFKRHPRLAYARLPDQTQVSNRGRTQFVTQFLNGPRLLRAESRRWLHVLVRSPRVDRPKAGVISPDEL